MYFYYCSTYYKVDRKGGGGLAGGPWVCSNYPNSVCEGCGGEEEVETQTRQNCVCLLLQDLLQSCARGGRRIVEDMCYEIRRAEACVD